MYLSIILLLSVAGALVLIADPTGINTGLHELWLNQTAFGTFIVPGLIILSMITLPVLVWLFLTIRNHPMVVNALKFQGILTAVALLLPLYLLHKINLWVLVPILLTAIGFWIAAKMLENELVT